MAYQFPCPRRQFSFAVLVLFSYIGVAISSGDYCSFVKYDYTFAAHAQGQEKAPESVHPPQTLLCVDDLVDVRGWERAAIHGRPCSTEHAQSSIDLSHTVRYCRHVVPSVRVLATIVSCLWLHCPVMQQDTHEHWPQPHGQRQSSRLPPISG